MESEAAGTRAMGEGMIPRRAGGCMLCYACPVPIPTSSMLIMP